ncbi:MAG: DUF3336 domain-containing protein, partial [Myxococcota bacterium]
EAASPLYDHALIRQRLDELVRLRASGDDERLLFALNEGIHGNLGGMGRAALYRRAYTGTKHLIVAYVDAVAEALEHLATETRSGISDATKRDFFHRASHCFGHTALMLSGSGTWFFFHVGVLRALHGEGLLPKVLSGSSGGALVAAVLGTRAPEEQRAALTVETFHPFLGDSGFVPSSVHHEMIERPAEVLEALYPDLTFAEAFERSGLSINVSVAPTDLHQRSRLLNAFTSPHVLVREAVMASSAFPGVFPPVTLMAKTADGERRPYLRERQWLDGSVSDDLPAKRLSRLFGVNHYIVSQTNPHVLPFITDPKLDTGTLAVLRRTGQRTLRELVNGGVAMLQPVLSKRMTRAATMLLSVMNQDYLGDINILPERPPLNVLRLLDYRTEQEARAMIESGERATWPHLEMIRTQTKISRTLDRILDLPTAERALLATPMAGQSQKR